RRYHSKSRLGCTQCKRRHIKCDENRPACANCTTSQLQCIYTAPAQHSAVPTENGSPPTKAASPQPLQSTSPASPFLSQSAQSRLPISSLLTPEDSNSSVNMHHMELLSHFILHTSLMLGPAHSSATRMSLAITLSTPYLINQVLALAALHLSYLRPERAREYADEAALFQTNSLSSLNSTTVEVSRENCVPMLLFSALLGIYTLADAVITFDGDNSRFLDRYIRYLDVHRGVNAVVDPFWDYLRSTELAPFLNSAALEPTTSSQQEIEEVCNRLQKLLDAADMAPPSLQACREAVHHLKAILGLLSHAQAFKQQTTADTIYSWPILLSAEFTTLLSRRRPEALIILAHYAVVLHERRDVWVVGDCGSWLIQAITLHLGSYWKEWLEWP
ncbi:uncharacterized protein EI97DRAFT_352347, partial [Westerdykella ornata]